MPESGITHLRAKRYDLEMANYHICEISNYLLILLPLKKQKEQSKNLAPFSTERILFFSLKTLLLVEMFVREYKLLIWLWNVSSNQYLITSVFKEPHPVEEALTTEVQSTQKLFIRL